MLNFNGVMLPTTVFSFFFLSESRSYKNSAVVLGPLLLSVLFRVFLIKLEKSFLKREFFKN